MSIRVLALTGSKDLVSLASGHQQSLLARLACFFEDIDDAAPIAIAA